jgi:hypothetical protein
MIKPGDIISQRGSLLLDYRTRGILRIQSIVILDRIDQVFRYIGSEGSISISYTCKG